MPEPAQRSQEPAAQQPLKRTFHGCLTCRKRKVRCKGGDPCQNCTRMNITCHSSFDTNLRIRVSTPTGAKDVETTPSRSSTTRRSPPSQQESQQYQQYQQHQQQQPMPAFISFDGHSQSFAPQVPSQYSGYPTSTSIGDPSSYAQVPMSYANFDTSTGAVPDMNQLQYQQFPDAAVWESYDYAYDPNDPNSLEYDYDPAMDLSMQGQLPNNSQHGGHQDASGWYGYQAQGGSGQQQGWR
ncbi:hypothetical protein B0T20DRAFT_452585 [Sordaria brevicollis]|uniref:Zn(2)-C6 fungal-type domain-containing protein n=1 Tax=Sordaria brevicollis TaxID=83679 RepID=A0AAE0UCT0_SORBR|nr:hypothetical protein B0T20DRAFT_452585 [Sordaria brevicollis]